MTAPHYGTNDQAERMFLHHLERSRPDTAVRSAITAGFSVRRDDIETPHLDAYGSLRGPDRSAYVIAHGPELSAERTAIQLIVGQENIRKRQAAEAESKRQDERAAFIKARIAELEAEHHATLRTKWTAQATLEASEKYDTATAPAPEPQRTKRKAS